MKSADETKAALNGAIMETSKQYSGNNQFSRQRKLPLETIIRLLIGAEGGSLAKVLHSAGVDATPAALSQRRAQIAPDVFREVFTRFNAACEDNETYLGYRILAVDGTAVNMPRNPNADSFVCNESAPKGYNQLHLNLMYDVCSKTFFDTVIQPEPQKNEIGALIEMLHSNSFDQKALIVCDRGYESYNMIFHILETKNADFLIRVKQNRSAMREIARLPMCELDCTIKFEVTTSQSKDDKLNHRIFIQVPQKSKPGATTRRGRWDFPSPYPLHFRIVRFQIDTGEYETIATSLPSSIGIETIKGIYRLRWGIETGFRDLKYTLGLVNLHGKSDLLAKQEIYSSLTTFNFASRVCHEVVVRQPTEGIYAYKVNFKMAVALCREYFRTSAADGTELMQKIAKHIIPIRPGRKDQRNIRAKGFVGFTYRVAA